MLKLVLLSGAVGSGKSTLADGLANLYPASKVKTVDYLSKLSEDDSHSRKSLQVLGEQLDKSRDGKWVLDAVLNHLDNNAAIGPSLIVVDAVRIESQVSSIRNEFGNPRVTHVHFTANEDELARRYKGRIRKDVKEFKSYAEVTKKTKLSRKSRRWRKLRISSSTLTKTPLMTCSFEYRVGWDSLVAATIAWLTSS